eukprot:scaffold11910_cov62-Phaeocystis_antarctica.AAC.2
MEFPTSVKPLLSCGCPPILSGKQVWSIFVYQLLQCSCNSSVGATQTLRMARSPLCLTTTDHTARHDT